MRVKAEHDSHKKHLNDIKKGHSHLNNHEPIGVHMKMGHNNPRNKLLEAEKQGAIDLVRRRCHLVN